MLAAKLPLSGWQQFAMTGCCVSFDRLETQQCLNYRGISCTGRRKVEFKVQNE